MSLVACSGIGKSCSSHKNHTVAAANGPPLQRTLRRGDEKPPRQPQPMALQTSCLTDTPVLQIREQVEKRSGGEEINTKLRDGVGRREGKGAC